MTTAERELQRTNALGIANKVRVSNAKLRWELSGMPHESGCERVAQLLLEPSGPVLSFPVGRLLTSVNKIGEAGMTRYLQRAGIFSTTKRVQALTPRQRAKLAELLRNRRLVYPTTAWDGLW